MLFDSILLFISGLFAAGLVLTESVVSSRLMAVTLFAIHVLLYWLVVMPYHNERIEVEAIDNIEIL